MKTLIIKIKKQQRAREIFAFIKLAQKNKQLRAELDYIKYKQKKNNNKII